MNRLPRNKAFTLIELLIVITIIGILAAALLPRITSGPAKARDAQRKADLQQISTALEFYADDNAGAYPATVAASPGSCLPASLSTYMTTVPNDPQDTGIDCASGYAYAQLDSGNGFILIAQLESNTGTGEGHYLGGAGNFTVTAANDYSTNLASNVAMLCETAACSSGTAIYVIGR